MFGVPSSYSRYRLVLFTSQQLRQMLDCTGAGTGSGGDPDELMLPSLDLIERHAPQLLERLLPAHGLPVVAMPWFTGRLTPYGEKCALNWTSPPVARRVRLRREDIVLACLY